MADTRLRVGIAGLGRRGRHHFERLSLREDFAVTAAFDPGGRRVEGPLAASCSFVPTWRDLVSADVDLVVIAAPADQRAEIGAAALRAGKGVAFDGWLTEDHAVAARLAGLAESHGAGLLVLNERLWDGEFLSAQAAVATSELGTLQAVQHISWSPPLVGGPDRSKGPLDDECDDEVHPAASGIDQALRLVRDRPIAVFSPRTDGPETTGHPAARGFSLWIRFAGGATASLEQRRDASLPYHPGWIITGTTGGYRRGKLYRRLADGEVYDVPFDEIATDDDGLYDDLRERAARPQAASLQHDLLVTAVLEAARRSADRGDVQDVKHDRSATQTVSTRGAESV